MQIRWSKGQGSGHGSAAIIANRSKVTIGRADYYFVMYLLLRESERLRCCAVARAMSRTIVDFSQKPLLALTTVFLYSAGCDSFCWRHLVSYSHVERIFMDDKKAISGSDKSKALAAALAVPLSSERWPRVRLAVLVDWK